MSKISSAKRRQSPTRRIASPARCGTSDMVRAGETTRRQAADVHGELMPQEPRGELSIRTLAMPADNNQNGDIFGGWLLGQMDIGGGIFSSKIAEGRTVT